MPGSTSSTPEICREQVCLRINIRCTQPLSSWITGAHNDSQPQSEFSSLKSPFQQLFLELHIAGRTRVGAARHSPLYESKIESEGIPLDRTLALGG